MKQSKRSLADFIDAYDDTDYDKPYQPPHEKMAKIDLAYKNELVEGLIKPPSVPIEQLSIQLH